MTDPLNTSPIPAYWSPEQALAVYECLQQLTDLVWERYQLQIIDLLGPDADPQHHTLPCPSSAQSDLFDSDPACVDLNDDPPF